MYRPSCVSPSGRRTLFPEESKLSDGNKKIAAAKQKHKGAQKSEVKDSSIDDDAAIGAAIEHNNNFTFSPIKRTTNDDERANKRTKKGQNVANKNNNKMDSNYYTTVASQLVT